MTRRKVPAQIHAAETLRMVNEMLEHQARRIAHALHGEAHQLLTSAHIMLADVARDLPAPARKRIQEVEAYLDQIEEELRGLAYELRPRILDDLGLLEALRFLAEGLEKRHGVNVVVKDSLRTRLPYVVEVTVYRVVQEALANVSHHAHAKRVVILLEQQTRILRCRVADDGVGFDAAAVVRPREPGMGLLSLRERLDMLGGTIRIESLPGHGTELTFTIPLET